MVGSVHTRRLAAIVVVGVCIVGASGCYAGRSTVGPGQGALNCPAGVDLGPGKISGGGDTYYWSVWQPAPTAVSVQFAVTNSDSTQPITVGVEYAYDAPPYEGASLGVVWDGTRSTGTKSVPLHLSPTYGFAFWLYAQAPNLAHMDWWMMALDAAGKEVGFADCIPVRGFGQ